MRRLLTVVLVALSAVISSDILGASPKDVQQIQGLKKSVRVQRDRWGIAHIYASNSHDLFFAQGYVVARDRLFQMELWKRSGQGRLAEVYGPEAVARDINARRLRYRGDMDAEYRSYAPDARAILEAFTQGINAYIAELQQPGGRGLPIEFQMAGFKPEFWRPEDCLNRLAAYSMTGNAAFELKHAQLVALLGADRATDLFDFDPAVKLDPAPGVDFSGLSPAILADLVGSDVRLPFAPALLHESNNWTISGQLTSSGKPLLANDPHRVLAEPSLRYLVHLVAPGWNVIGAGEPALPGVAAGHNEHIGWGFTIFDLDQQDLYLEKLNPADPLQYRTATGWKRMQVVHETIAVRGAPATEVDLTFTKHGPVVWQQGARAIALHWVGSEPGTAGYLGSLSLDRARNWKEFEAAMPRWKVPAENIVYADRNGHIGEYSTGLAPLRKTWTGLLPVPGDAHFEWSGFIPSREMPHTFNPSEQFVATANNNVVPQGYQHPLAFEWPEPNRYRRIRESLEAAKSAGRKLDVSDMKALQSDVLSVPAREVQQMLRVAVSKRQTSANDELQPIIQSLLQWDCKINSESREAAIYEMWTLELREAVSARVVPANAAAALGSLSLTRVVQELSRPRDSVFGRDPETGRDALLFTTLQAARVKLTARLGPDTQAWKWGDLHRLVFQHVLNSVPWAAKLLDRGPFPLSGDGDTVRATYFADDTFNCIGGASYREIFDLADWDQSVGINVPGQSGQPGSRHYDDLLPLWLENQYFPLTYSKAAVDSVTADTLELAPGRD